MITFPCLSYLTKPVLSPLLVGLVPRRRQLPNPDTFRSSTGPTAENSAVVARHNSKLRNSFKKDFSKLKF